MLIHAGMVLLILVSMAYGAAVMRRIEGDVSSFQRESRHLESERHRLEAACKALRDLIQGADADVEKARAELEKVLEIKAEAEANLQRLAEAPKQRLILFDRATLGQGKLWEVSIIHEGTAPDPAHAQQWAGGRVYLTPGVTDREARHRAEPRFSPAMGYRITGVERFRRG
jgi:hypothetical protein